MNICDDPLLTGGVKLVGQVVEGSQGLWVDFLFIDFTRASTYCKCLRYTQNRDVLDHFW